MIDAGAIRRPADPDCRGRGIRKYRRAHEEGYDIISERCPCTDGPAITGENMSEENSETTVGENVGSIYLTTATAFELAREFEHRMMELERAYETVKEVSNAEADLYGQRIAELARENEMLREENAELREAMRQEVQRLADSAGPSTTWRRPRRHDRREGKQMSETQRKDSTEKQAWEHIAPELPPGWSVENSGDMDYQQNWATRAADGTVTERGFCGREYAVEDCWEQFGTPQKSWAELIAPGLVREAAAEAWGEHAKVAVEYGRDWVCIRVMGAPYQHAPIEHERPTICDAAWACIQALGGGE